MFETDLTPLQPKWTVLVPLDSSLNLCWSSKADIQARLWNQWCCKIGDGSVLTKKTLITFLSDDLMGQHSGAANRTAASSNPGSILASGDVCVECARSPFDCVGFHLMFSTTFVPQPCTVIG